MIWKPLRLRPIAIKRRPARGITSFWMACLLLELYRCDCAQKVHEPGALEGRAAPQVSCAFQEDVLDGLRISAELAMHREEGRDRAGYVGRGHTGAALLL